MDSQNNKTSYSKITYRELLLIVLFLSALCVGVIVFSIRDLANGQYFKPLLRIIFTAIFLFCIGYSFKKVKAAARKKVKSFDEIGERERFHMKSNVIDYMPAEEEDTPLVAKVVLGFYLLLMVGLGLFAFTIYCKSISASPTHILGYALLFGGAIGLAYFVGPVSQLTSMTVNERYEPEIRRLSVTEQIIAVMAIIALCTGIVLCNLY